MTMVSPIFSWIICPFFPLQLPQDLKKKQLSNRFFLIVQYIRNTRWVIVQHRDIASVSHIFNILTSTIVDLNSCLQGVFIFFHPSQSVSIPSIQCTLDEVWLIFWCPISSWLLAVNPTIFFFHGST